MEALKCWLSKSSSGPVATSDSRLFSRAGISNISELADVSDYEVVASEGANPVARTPAWKGRGRVCLHDRRQSVWALVAKAAAWAAAEAEKHM